MIQGIAVTGISVEAPGVRNIHDFWQMISRGESRDGRFPAERRGAVEEFVTYLWDSALEGPQDRTVSFHNGYFMDLEDISSFDAPFFGMSPRQAATTDPHLRMILRNMYRAFEDGGYSADTISGTRTGVYVGYASNPTQTYMDYLSRIDTSLGITSLMGNIPTMMANRLSHHFNLLGPSMVVDTACSASLVALHHAKNALLLGECDQAVVAGARIVFAPVDHPQSRIGIESSDGVTRTFDDRADGTGLGEGSGAVLLKRLDQAVADGDRIYAVIRGSAVNHDGRTEIMTSPDSASQERLLRSAWDSAGIEPRTLGYVEVHGTATKVGDPIEFEGLRRAFAHYTPDRGFCAVGTVKANIGHLFEGSGIMGVIKSVLALRNREIPPQAHFQRPNSLIDFAGGPVYVPTSAQPWERNGTPRRCGVSAFGLGGTNCHVVLEEYAPADADADAAEDTGQPQLFTISARTAPSLRALIREYADFIAQGRFAGTALADLCYTSNVSRASHEHRLALLADDVEELRTGLLLALDDQGTEVGGRAGTGRRALLAERAEAYLNGEQLQVSDLYKDRSPRVVGLVPYQFDEARHWIEFPASWAQSASRGTRIPAGPVTHTVDFEPAAAAPEPAADAKVLALVDPGNDADEALRRAGIPGLQLLGLTAGEGELSDDEAEFERIADLVADGGYTHVVHALAFERTAAADPAELDRRLRKNLHSLFQLGKALMLAGAEAHLVVLTRKALAAEVGEAALVTENAALAGLAKAITHESPHLPTRVVDVDDAVAPARLRAEVLLPEPGLRVLRGERCFQEVFRELPDLGAGPAEPAESAEPAGPVLKPGGTYLITGGTGSLGLAVARDFAAQQPDITLYLVSRSGAPQQEGDAFPAEHRSGRQSARAKALEEIAALGATVRVRAADAGSPAQLAAVVAEIQAAHGRVDGVVHAAGIPGESMIAFRESEDFMAVLRPKIHGAFTIDRLTAEDRPDFIVHFSSVATVFPAGGQGDYAAANYYLDNLARANADDRCHVLALDWVAWKEIGMAVDYGTSDDTTFKALPTATALAVLDEALRSGQHRVFAGQVHYEGDLLHLLTGYDIGLAPALAERIAGSVAAGRERRQAAAERTRGALVQVEVELTGRPGDSYSSCEIAVAKCWAKALGYAEIDVQGSFFALGGDSIMAMSVATDIAALLDIPFEFAGLLADPTVEGTARLIEDEHGQVTLPAARGGR